jgi:hypothetical protein
VLQGCFTAGPVLFRLFQAPRRALTPARVDLSLALCSVPVVRFAPVPAMGAIAVHAREARVELGP